MAGNQLSGVFPSAPGVDFWQSIEYLDFSDNKIKGPVPVVFPPSLNHLDLSGNDLEFGIPTEFALFPNLNFLSLSDNSLRGSIPAAVAGLASLKTLMLRNCGLIGTIPREIARGAVETLDLGENTLTGTIFTEFGSISTLQRLRLDNNRLSGTLPSEIGLLELLDELTLAQNSLSGTIPIQFSLLNNLEEFTVAGNFLQGSVPPGICSIVEDLSTQDVGCDLACGVVWEPVLERGFGGPVQRPARLFLQLFEGANATGSPSIVLLCMICLSVSGQQKGPAQASGLFMTGRAICFGKVGGNTGGNGLTSFLSGHAFRS
eukprot:CAMPEP_0116826878 /NCGR_PEP_ID=MMETSP0418-20121206/2779_1 /TAXON_ID=1158023 /ORGANISM="Astrosyne radiata, Strain 13vi08-1A" /LENGTH=316 /DNA_ID=CAMNT_0004455573 /DNA_START=1090 /DNA_END=2041 /DNA_ORIENTATION=+